VASPNLRAPAFPNYSTSNVYRVTELIGTSESSWEDAAKHAVETATKTLRDLRVAEVNKLDLIIVDGKVTASARG
jgi:flavin-binding protein dodecin